MRLILYALALAVSLACRVSAASPERETIPMPVTRAETVAATPSIVGDTSAVGPCAALHPSLHVIGAFESTASDVADWVENVAYPDRPHVVRSVFRSYPPLAPVFACYFAGLWNPPIGPPGPACPASASNSACAMGSPDTTVYDRALYFVDAHGVELYPSKIAPSSLLPMRRPGGPF
jgi:hypothetical protein